MSKMLLIFVFILLFSFSLKGCYSDLEEITVYPMWYHKTNKEKLTPIPFLPMKFTIWKRKGIVISHDFNSRTSTQINKNCIIENENNWFCYKNEIESKKVLMNDLNTGIFIEIDDKNLLVDYGVINGKWITQLAYATEPEKIGSKVVLYSIPYWKWILYKYKILKKPILADYDANI